ncbi:MAG: response regulator, partial [Gallionella sp.]
MNQNLTQNSEEVPVSFAELQVAGGAARQESLLFVDDDSSILAALKRLFRPLGYRILTAGSGAAGLEIMEKEVVDLVVSDMRMPDMNGAQFLEQVCAKWPDTIRILLTGYAEISSTIDIINKGKIYRYISKPWEDDDIVSSVKQALGQRQIEKNKRKNGNTEILIAEDSRTQAELLAFMLKQNGYKVTIAANGKLALQAVQAQKPALLISDIVMPEMDGYALCKAIKSDEKLKDIPVILVTTLSNPEDVIRGLECGADNFIRKPYDERYLLSRIDYLLMNLEFRKNQKMQMGVEIELSGHKYFINSERQQILDLLISTYEQAVHINAELKLREMELEHSNQVLNGLYNLAAGLNHAITEHQVAEAALEWAVELPEIQAGWISLWDEKSGFRLVAARNLPVSLQREGAMEGLCNCQRRFFAGELDRVTNILECERLKGVPGDTHDVRHHASVPLWAGERPVGIMNLVGTGRGQFDEAALRVLYGIGNQVAVALERARLYEHLEQLVDERTAELRNSEGKLNRAQAVAQIGSWNLDIASNRLEWSAEAHRIFGIPGKEATDLDTFVSTLHPDDRERVLKSWGDAVAGAPYDIEHRIVAGGETRWVRERAII